MSRRRRLYVLAEVGDGGTIGTVSSSTVPERAPGDSVSTRRTTTPLAASYSPSSRRWRQDGRPGHSDRSARSELGEREMLALPNVTRPLSSKVSSMRLEAPLGVMLRSAPFSTVAVEVWDAPGWPVKRSFSSHQWRSIRFSASSQAIGGAGAVDAHPGHEPSFAVVERLFPVVSGHVRRSDSTGEAHRRHRVRRLSHPEASPRGAALPTPYWPWSSIHRAALFLS